MKKIIFFASILLSTGLIFIISSTNVWAAEKRWEEYREKVEDCIKEIPKERIPFIQQYYKAEELYATHVGVQTGRICWDECSKKYNIEDYYSKLVPCYHNCLGPYETAKDQAFAEVKESTAKTKNDLQECFAEAKDWYESIKQEDYSQFCSPTVHKERAEILEIAGKWELEECEEKVENCNEKARVAREEIMNRGNYVYGQFWDYLGNCIKQCTLHGINWDGLSECIIACYQADILPDYKQDNQNIAQELEKIDSDFEGCIAEVEDWYEGIEEKVINNYLSRDISGEKIFFQVWGLEGNVYVKPKGQDEWYKLKKDYRLIEGDIVRTTSNGMIGFKDSSGTRIEMDTNTQIGMKKLEEARRFYKVHAGITRFNVPKPGEAWQEIVIESLVCIVGVRGTDFIVKVEENESTEVSVLDGEVSVSDIEQKETVIVKPGQVSKVERNDIPSQPQEYEEDVGLILEKLKIKEEIPIWIWIAGGMVALIIISIIIIIIKSKKKR